MLSDDDDFPEPLSTADALKTAEHGRGEKLKPGLEQKERMLLKKKIELKQAKDALERRRSDQVFGTKTKEQQVRAQAQDAKAQPRADQVIEEARREEAAQQQGAYEQEQKLP